MGPNKVQQLEYDPYAAQPQEQTRTCGQRVWRYVRPVLGFVSAATAASLAALRYYSPWNSSATVAPALTAVGIGAAGETAIEVALPSTTAKVYRQVVAHAAMPLFFALWQANLNTGGSAQEAILATLASLCGQWAVTKISMLVFRTLDQDGQTNYRPLDQGKTITLLLEPETEKAFVVSQTGKTMAGTALLITYFVYPKVTVHARNAGLMLLGHVAGCSIDRLFHVKKQKIEERYQQQIAEGSEEVPWRLRAMRISSQATYLFGNNLIGILFLFDHAASYTAIGVVLGGTKSSSKRRFQKVDSYAGLEEYVSLQKVQSYVDGALGLGFASWYIAVMINPGGSTPSTADRLAVSAFLLGLATGYGTAKKIDAIFKPGDNSKAVNSLRFYTREHPAAFSVVPLYVLQHMAINDDALSKESSYEQGIAFITWTLYGGAFGNDLGQRYPISRFSQPLDMFATKLIADWVSGRLTSS